jgi:peptidoglycan/LPS O-acetylase OafA/YrhL
METALTPVQGAATPAGGAATTGTGRVGNVDVLRAVAALAVLLGHAYSLGGRAIPVRAERWYDVLLLQTVTGVWLFFAISGYVIGKPFIDRLATGRPLPELVPYALKRALRIFPLYWIALLAVIVVAGAGPIGGWQYPLHLALLHNLVPGREGAVFSVAWTLTLEVLFYIAVPLLALALRRATRISAERLAWLILASWLASIAFTVLAGMHEPDRTGLWLRGSLPAMWQMFCPGLLLAVAPHLRTPAWRRWVVDLPASRRVVLVLGAALGAATLLGSVAPRRYGVEVYVLLTDASRPLFAIGFGIVLAAAIRARPMFAHRGRFALRLGLVSYGIYLLHAVLLGIFLSPRAHWLLPLPHGGLGAYAVHVVFLAGLTIPLAMLSWRWLEQPCVRLAARLGDRWRLSRRAPASRERPAAG